MKIALYLLVGTFLLTATAQAETTPAACSSLVQECFAYTNTARTQCFRSVSKHSACQGSELGQLAAQRLAMSVDEETTPDAAGGGLAFMGPQTIDPTCLEQFDISLSSSLVAGRISADTVKQLRQRLSNCESTSEIELPNP